MVFRGGQQVRFPWVRRQRQVRVRVRLAWSVPSDQAGEKQQKAVHIREDNLAIGSCDSVT